MDTPILYFALASLLIVIPISFWTTENARRKVRQDLEKRGFQELDIQYVWPGDFDRQFKFYVEYMRPDGTKGHAYCKVGCLGPIPITTRWESLA